MTRTQIKNDALTVTNDMIFSFTNVKIVLMCCFLVLWSRVTCHVHNDNLLQQFI